MSFQKYYDMGRIEQLRNGGRELIGRMLCITVKRDGQNCSFYQNPNSSMINLASHNQAIAADDIRDKVKSTKEYPKILEMMEENDAYKIYVEHIPRGFGATRIERKKKYNFLVLIDIFDSTTNRYFNYNYVYQMAHTYKVPVVKQLDIFQPETLEEIIITKDHWLKWCKKHFREGIVIKDYSGKEQIFVKEKINLPKLKKFRTKGPKIELPPMPQDKIDSALNQAMAEVLREGFDPKDPKLAMPIVARYITTEAREHCYATPRQYFQHYIQYLTKVSYCNCAYLVVRQTDGICDMCGKPRKK